MGCHSTCTVWAAVRPSDTDTIKDILGHAAPTARALGLPCGCLLPGILLPGVIKPEMEDSSVLDQNRYMLSSKAPSGSFCPGSRI